MVIAIKQVESVGKDGKIELSPIIDKGEGLITILAEKWHGEIVLESQVFQDWLKRKI